MDRSGANEDTYPMLVISRLITVTYLPTLLEWEEAQPKNLHVVHLKFQFTALLTQSEINFDIYMHQNLPQFFAETLSPTVLLVFWIISPKHVADVFGLLYQHYDRRFLFDDEFGHGNHSGELLLFVGCFVNFIVSYLICMFQDSVPAGSYNDPFLSSVCVCWACIPVSKWATPLGFKTWDAHPLCWWPPQFHQERNWEMVENDGKGYTVKRSI